MELEKILLELREERQMIQDAISRLERVSAWRKSGRHSRNELRTTEPMPERAKTAGAGEG